MGSNITATMPSTSVLAASVLLALFVHTVVVFGRPQELKCPNGDPFYPNAGTADENRQQRSSRNWFQWKFRPLKFSWASSGPRSCQLIKTARKIHRMGKKTSLIGLILYC